MGTLFRRGTRAMSDLIVAHLTEDLKDEDFRVFLRTLHLSGITARADVVLIFSTKTSNFFTMIHQENESFLKLVQNSTRVNGFDLTMFTKESKPGGEPLWGRKIHTNSSITEEVTKNELSYGSVVGFEVSELDPVESLSGFLDHIPIRLRRWACYPMLLGRVRRNFKHIMLVNAKDVILLGDSLTRVRSKGAESIHLWKNSGNSRSHGKKDTKSVTADAIMGGMRGIRLLSNAMLNEIVRAAIQHKSKSTILDSVILSQLVNNESLLKSLNIITSTESSIPSATSLVSTNNSIFASSSSIDIVHRDNSNNNKNLDVNYILHRNICSSVLDSFVYMDCYQRESIV
ncbi:transmembrane protein [Thalictrum thalictroides]|uniref:Transmembrane protein n=1 Tax=Thalictrum thalictroides TaxID=46969 RepID=A0A7J6V5T9_THATH|nr:transmembrane protein [Thalictrum thalictroides]